MRDVAQAAGVSPATVSRVLSGKDVTAELRDRVRAAATELGYRPNGLARSLRTRATMVIGLVITDVSNPFFTAIARGVEDAAQSAGYSVVLANSDENIDKEQRYLEVAAAEQMAGIVLAPASSHDTSIDLLLRYGIPVVAVDRELPSYDVDAVTIDNFRAAKQATTHLIEQGCERIGFIGGPTNTTTGERRLAGYRAAVKEHGLPRDRALVRRSDFRAEGGYAATETLLGLDVPPDGLLVGNNLMTLGALEAIQERGLELPRDLALVGFDGMSWARAIRPSLTVVEQPTYAIGRQSAELLLARIANPTAPTTKSELASTLKVGASSLRRKS